MQQNDKVHYDNAWHTLYPAIHCKHMCGPKSSFAPAASLPGKTASETVDGCDYSLRESSMSPCALCLHSQCIYRATHPHSKPPPSPMAIVVIVDLIFALPLHARPLCCCCPVIRPFCLLLLSQLSLTLLEPLYPSPFMIRNHNDTLRQW